MGAHVAPVNESDADVRELRGLYQATLDGWNRGSGAEFAAPFTEDVDFVAFDGTRFHGRDELVRFHDPLFSTHLRGTRLVGDVTDVRFLRTDVAVVHAAGSMIPRGATRTAPERDSIQTLVAMKQDGRWLFAAFQNTRVRPIGRSLPGTLLWLFTDRLWRWCLPAG
jgi:uncharacterized protein (TIGR02246 family)